MNIETLYNIEHFDSYNNIYTIYKKHIVTYKRVTDEEESDIIENNNGNRKYKIQSDYYKLVPVYGHHFNNNNHFICKKIAQHRIVADNSPNNFLIIKNEELVRAYKGGLYIGKDINDLYDIINRLNTYNKQNEES